MLEVDRAPSVIFGRAVEVVVVAEDVVRSDEEVTVRGAAGGFDVVGVLAPEAFATVLLIEVEEGTRGVVGRELSGEPPDDRPPSEMSGGVAVGLDDDTGFLTAGGASHVSKKSASLALASSVTAESMAPSTKTLGP